MLWWLTFPGGTDEVDRIIAFPVVLLEPSHKPYLGLEGEVAADRI